MEDAGSDINAHRSAIISELNNIQNTTQNLVKDLQALVALTDPEGGKLIQSQDKALSSLEVWKSMFAAAAPDTE